MLSGRGTKGQRLANTCRRTRSLERMRAGRVIWQFGRAGPPASLSSGVRIHGLPDYFNCAFCDGLGLCKQAALAGPFGIGTTSTSQRGTSPGPANPNLHCLGGTMSRFV